MIVYLCNGQAVNCCKHPNCGVYNPEEGQCFHTTNHAYSLNDPDVSAEALKDPTKWEVMYCGGSSPQYWEKRND